ncbi:MAG: Ig-like domain-containing protein [Accumulibacter sp.]|jgi:RHS repeat-associated protein|uniref:Ig-like domain-containing protein n=1 Tax=Accumulibacter sp. TaxID=2053492 RepID=UPI002FC353AD
MPSLRQPRRHLATFLLLVLSGLISLAQAAPTVSLSAPTAGSYLAPVSLTVSATATARAGTTLTQVEFLDGASVLATLTASPYTFTWNNVPAGSHRLTARATDRGGGVTTSAARTITVNSGNTPPSVTGYGPTGGVYALPIRLAWKLAANGGEVNTPITRVDLYDGDTMIGSNHASFNTLTWTPTAAGNYTLSVTVTDSAGGVITRSLGNFTITASNTPPTVSLTAPADGAVYSLPVTISVSATADGVEVNTPITRVDFYQGTTLIGGSTARPYTLFWTPTTAGSYPLTAQATDSAGGVTTSPARTVTVQAANQAPNVSLTSPLANQSFTAPATVTLSATASDPDGSIAQVEFFQGTTRIGSATEAPYSVVWNAVPAGSYSLTAKATDYLGATRSSPAVAITVTGSGPTILYLHGDHLGTPRVATNEANVVVWRNLPTGEPFGMALPEEDPDGDGRATVINLRFPGQYFDRETGLHYNYFRDYDPGVGRYVQSDSIGLAGGLNPYAYVDGNPISFSDPNGLRKIILLKPNDSNYRAAVNAPDIPGICLVIAHGNSQAVSGNNAAQLNRLLQDLGCTPKEPVVLDACRTGQGDNSIAEQLAKQRDGIVVAPDERTWTTPWGTDLQHPYPPLGEGFPLNRFPNVTAPGGWHTFTHEGRVRN